MAQQMDTFAARLATFDLVLHPDTRRTSGSKAADPISWPHSRPSPAELAHAGFFYNPYATNPDNTTCFLCRRALDGWEEDDNPITEHLKHSKDCGWAIMMDIQQRSSNPAEIEDPTSERIAQARQATFGESWPHDGKRGWVCQSEKMVEGGWYFCPNEESVDLASCAYCKLSLDGWEPKDDPFDEHYRRSSDCSFFTFAKPPTAKGKAPRSKKGRTSKASRLSTQSTASEILASDVEDAMDQSVLSQSSKPKATKKSSKSKAKSSKSKKADALETASQMDVDEPENAQPEPSKTKRSNRGKKRSSAALDIDTVSIADGESVGQPEPPAKKRATKSRTSVQAQSDTDIEPPRDESEAPEDNDDLTSSRGTAKKKTSRSRKASGASSTSKATSKSRLPRDSELDAAIEAGLEADEPGMPEKDEKDIEKTVPKTTSKKSKAKKKTAKKEVEPLRDVDDHPEEIETHAADISDVDHEMLDEKEKPAAQRAKPTKGKTKRQASRAIDEEKDQVQSGEQQMAHNEDDQEHHESFVSVEIISKHLEQHSDSERSGEDSKKKLKKKTSSEKPKKSKKAQKKAVEQSTEPRITPEEQPSRATPELHAPEQRKQEELQDQDTERRSSRRSSKVPPKTTERYSDIPQEKQYAKSLAESRVPIVDGSAENSNSPSKQLQEDEAVSPLPSVSRGSPSLSPQSSDAENHPPSLKPSAHPPAMSSPSKNAAVRVPLAASTPSPSKRNAPAGKIKTSHPWVPIDFDDILLASASDKENVVLNGAFSNMKGELTSPEKKMTVQEWIIWNAKNGEERLKRECERLVGQFEREGARAMRTLEGIECID